MKKFHIILAVFCLLNLVVFKSNLLAQDFWFKTNGPFGGSVYSVAYGSGNNVYVGTELKGVFTSSDAGLTWTQSGLDGYTINSIYIDSSNRIFASKSDGGLFRSTNSGLNWSEITYDVSKSVINDITCNDTGRLFVGTVNGIFASDNNGTDWNFYSSDLPANTRIFSLTAALDSMIYTGTNTGVYRSNNNANDWIAFNNILSSTTVMSLAVDSNKYVFAGTLDKGVYFSADSGKSWVARNTGLGNYNISSIVIDSLNHIFISVFDYANGGIYKSTNLGVTWTKVGAGLLTHYPLALDISKNNIICGTEDIGVALSLDLGDNWNESNNGLLNSHITSLLFVSDSILLAGHQGGIVKTIDFGSNWLNRNSGLGNKWVNSLTRNNDDIIFAGTEGGVYYSDDFGETWLTKNLGLGNPNIQALAVDNSNKVLAGTENGIYRLDNLESSWQFLDLPGVIIKSITVTSGGVILAGTEGFGVYRSTDNGQNWTNDNAGLTSHTVTDFEILTDGKIFASTSGFGIYISGNNGDSWSLTNSGLGNLFVNNLITDPIRNLYAATENGCYISTNQGETWNSKNSVMDDQIVTTFAVQENGHVFSGTFGDGVYFTSAPLISSIESTELYYFEGTGLQFITDSIAISDLNSKNMSRAEIQIIENFDPLEDTLSFENMVLISGAYDSRSGLLTLSGSDTRSNYEQAIRSVLYANSNTLHRENSSKKLSVTVYDASLSSNILYRDLNLIRINEPPIISDLPDVYFKANKSDSLHAIEYISDADHDISLLQLSAEVIDFQRIELRSENKVPINPKEKTNELFDADDLNITINNVNKIVYFSATQDSGGVFTVLVRVTDPDLGTDTDTILVNIERLPVYVNNPPVVQNAIANYTFNEDGGIQVVVPDIREVIIDPDPGDQLSFYLSIDSDSIDAEIVDYQIIANAPHNYFGSGSFTLSAIDTSGESVSDEFTITVTPVNDPPVVSPIPAIVFEEDENYSLDLDNYVSDIDNSIDDIDWYISFPENVKKIIQNHFISLNINTSIDIVTNRQKENFKSDRNTIDRIETEKSFEKIQLFEITANVDDSLVISYDTLTHVVSISATPNFTYLNIPIIFTAMDPEFDSDSDTTSISVQPVNDPPIVFGLPSISINEDDSLYYSISAWRDFISDIDNTFDELLFSVPDTSDHITIEAINDSTGLIKATKNWFGFESFPVKISDGIDSVFSSFTIVFKSVNDKPEFYGVPENVTFANDSTVEFFLFDLASDIETADSLLAFEFSTSNDSLSFSFNDSTGVLRIKSLNYFSGYADLSLRVLDDSSAYADTTIHFYVQQTHFPVVTVPEVYLLEQNFPNPFNPGTTIKFDLPVDSEVKIQIYNSIGQRIAILQNGLLSKGFKSLIFYAGDLPSGVYFYSIYAKSLDKTKDFFSVKKMMILK